MVGGQGQVPVPVPNFLIEHPRGLVLFDTGLVPETATDPQGIYGPVADDAGIAMTPDQQVDSQARALGYRTDDVAHVLVSHSHFDRTGGVPLFPGAELYSGRGELPDAYWPMWSGSPTTRRTGPPTSMPRPATTRPRCRGASTDRAAGRGRSATTPESTMEEGEYARTRGLPVPRVRAALGALAAPPDPGEAGLPALRRTGPPPLHSGRGRGEHAPTRHGGVRIARVCVPPR
jgi:glyoxylase-like metal-dependent hydrolase (beta-lactamase superfamily II)